MFSDIQNILPKTPASDAKAQQSDTRQEILRHDPEQERQKKNKHASDDREGLFGDDLTEVSLDMLEVFLQQVLENYTGQDGTEKNTLDEDVHIYPSVSEDSASAKQNAKAIGAYARTASYTSHDENHHLPHPAPSASTPQLSSADMQLVYQMQKDLSVLKEKGVSSISIIQASPEERFLQTIHNGVKRALL